MSYFNSNYQRAVEAASRGEGRAMTDEEMYTHMVAHYPQCGEFFSMQDVIRYAISNGYALRHCGGRLFLLPDDSIKGA